MSAEANARAKANLAARDLRARMDGHDTLPPEWRALSCMVHGRVAEFKFKQGLAIDRARWQIIHTHRGSAF